MAGISFQGVRASAMQKQQYEIDDRKSKSFGIVHYGEVNRCGERGKSQQDARATSTFISRLSNLAAPEFNDDLARSGERRCPQPCK